MANLLLNKASFALASLTSCGVRREARLPTNLKTAHPTIRGVAASLQTVASGSVATRSHHLFRLVGMLDFLPVENDTQPVGCLSST